MNTSNTPIEIERKFLISMPSTKALERIEGTRKKQITQTYLVSEQNITARVRKIVENERTTYVKTEKSKISSLSHYENEFEITKEQYETELTLKDINKKPIEKVRYCIPYSNHILEIDIYPFWNDRAILEIELCDENERFDIPEYIRVIKEVSDDKRYKNTNLAKEIPLEDMG